MAGYYHDEENYQGPHRAEDFNTMNLGEPHRASQPNTMNLGPGPQRVPQFDTMDLGAPMRVQEAPAKVQNYQATGQTPIHPAASAPSFEMQGGANGGLGRMPKGLVIASLCLRAAAVFSLIIAVAVLAADSQTVDGVTYSATAGSSTKYALAVAIVGVVYSIYETISIAMRLGMGHFFLPGKAPLFVSYIGDQIVIVLLLTGASAATATLNDLHDLDVGSGSSACDIMGSFCNQAGGATAMIFLGFCFLAASLVISSFCFYKNRF